MLLERLVETRLREVLEGMVGGFFGAGGTIILHSPGLLLLVTSSLFFIGVAAAVVVTRDLPLAGRLTSLSIFLLALADVVRHDDSLMRLLLLLLITLLITLLIYLVVDAHRCVVDSQ